MQQPMQNNLPQLHVEQTHKPIGHYVHCVRCVKRVMYVKGMPRVAKCGIL
jgi:hypothetical protein